MTAVVELVTAGLVLATAVVAWHTRRQVARMAQMVERVRQLTEALDQSGTAVPPAPQREHGG